MISTPSILPKDSSKTLPKKCHSLTVEVPGENNTDDEDLSDYEDSSEYPDKVKYERITQLPTPIVNHGSFASYAPEPLDVKKLRSNLIRDNHHLTQLNRIASEYDPSIPTPLANFKRYVSNPSFSLTRSGSIKSTKSVDSNNEEDNCRYSGQTFTIYNHNFQFVDQIGRGNFSTVIRAADNQHDVAIKIISIPTTSQQEVKNFKSYIKRELNILYQLNHPCIIQLLGYKTNLTINDQEITSPTYFTKSESQSDLTNSSDTDFEKDYEKLKQNNDQLLFLNYCPGGNLYKFLVNHYNLFENTLSYWLIIERIVCEILIAVKYLHQVNIIHRDIKLENVLLKYELEDLLEIFHQPNLRFPKPIINLTDFGLSKKLHDANELLSTRCGSQDYIPPELLMGVKYNGKLTDSWSIGVLIYSILENRLPFDVPPLSAIEHSQISPSVIKRKRANQNPAHRIAIIDWNWWKVNEMLNNNCDPQIKRIVSNLKSIVDLLLVRKDKRQTITQIIESRQFSWIKQCIPNHFDTTDATKI